MKLHTLGTFHLHDADENLPEIQGVGLTGTVAEIQAIGRLVAAGCEDFRVVRKPHVEGGHHGDAMTYADHTANYRRFQGALICEQCHALYETCPHHRRGIRAALRALWQRWARNREQQEVAKLRRQLAAMNAQLSEAEGRLDEEIERRRKAEQELVLEKLARAGYLAASAPGKVRPQG